ncbi:MAG: histidine phosphatase family protein [Chloroflexi bacterium]|nr:histidine phosphatase family protein [Chloroflexota bacterium]MCY3937079.1 histidine phosphatase family protein [Chloroflexota bacterium]
MGSWYLVRHGETLWNRIGRVQGHIDVVLSERGKRQAEMLGKRLAERRFAAVYASDLSRTMETARGIVADDQVAIEADSDLREFSFGEWEGLTLEEAEARNPKVYAERMRMRNHAFAAPGGENTTQLLKRVRPFCSSAVRRHSAADDVLVVAHGGTIRALLICLLDLEDEGFWRLRVDCGSLSIVSNHPGGRVLDVWNDTSHLDAEVL